MFETTRSALLGCATLALLLTFAAPASADVISPDEAACQGKTEGAACDADGTQGTCQASECCKLDYSQGTPPKSVCGPCLRCKSGAAADAGAGDAAAADSAAADTGGASADAAIDTGSVVGQDSGPSTGTTDGGSSGGSCSAAESGLPPWTLPGLFVGAAALLWLRRRNTAR